MSPRIGPFLHGMFASLLVVLFFCRGIDLRLKILQ